MKWLLIAAWFFKSQSAEGTMEVTPKFIEMPSQEVCLQTAKLNKDYQCWARVQ